jgi:hypothetical protein
MVDICIVSFTARDTTFTLLPGQTVVFRPVAPQLDSAGSILRLRRAVTAVANGAGAVTVNLTPGPYLLEAQVDQILRSVPCEVPDAASATIDECIAAIPSYLKQLGNLPIYDSTAAAGADTSLPGSSLFVAPDGTNGLTVYVKITQGINPPVYLTSINKGPVFPSVPFPAGNQGAPGLPVNGDADTGLFSPAPNQLAGVSGGVLGWLLSSAGLQITGPVFGNAVTQTAQDSTLGRLLKVGDGGINLVGSVNYLADVDSGAIPQGLWQTDGGGPGTLGTFPAGQNRYGHLLNFRVATNEVWQVFKSIVGRRIFSRARTSGAWSAWEEIYHAGSVLGTVAQSGGVPTGRVIERGTNANGEYVRFADGTQICTRTNLSAANASTALGAVFRSADVAWTFPVTFIAAPVVQGDVDDADCWLTTSGAPSATTVNVRAIAAVTKAGALTLRATAIGRWF